MDEITTVNELMEDFSVIKRDENGKPSYVTTKEMKRSIANNKMNKGEKYQCWLRNWETMEYVCIYVTARSIDEAFDILNKNFRSTHQAKSVITEEEGFISEIAGSEKLYNQVFEETVDEVYGVRS
jgi:hypothetical protein